MKIRIAVFLQLALLLMMVCFPVVAAAGSATEISLSLSKNAVLAGESVTASGTTAPEAWVPLKVIDEEGNILVFDAKKADANGNYNIEFIVPDGASGELTVVVGEGVNVAVGTLTVGKEPPVETVAKPKATPAGGAVVAGTKVTLATTTAGATIYYTLDGSIPTADSIAYTGPITVNAPVTIKVIATKAGMNPSEVLTISYTIAVPITDTEISVDSSNKVLAITEDTLELSEPVKINVPDNVKDAQISVTSLMNDPVGGMVTTSVLPALDIETNDNSISSTAPVQVSIPAGATVSAPEGWNGTINVPTVQPANTVTVDADPGKTATISNVIEIGYGDVPLTFSKAVRLVIPGQASKDAGYYRSGVFTKILSLPPGAQDNQTWADQNIPAGGDGKMDVGSDLVIWTKHFTKFVTYTQTTTGSGPVGGGGGGGVTTPKAVTSDTGSAMVMPNAGGSISLGGEATIEIPANALTGNSAVEIKIAKVTSPPDVPTGFRLVGDVYDFSVDGKSSYSFAKNVILTFKFNTSAIDKNEVAAVCYYDETAKEWLNIGGTVSGSNISVKVDHLTKFAVFAVKEDKIPVEQPVPALSDISGHWAEGGIKELVGLGAISGYPDGTFKPDNKINRGEFTSILVRAFNLEHRSGKVFADTAGHWAQEAIATATSYGIVSGYNAEKFGPDDPVTREQMAVMVVQAAALTPVTEALTFTDSGSISGWARESMAAAVKNNLIKGYPDNTVRPQSNATRAEAVTVIVSALAN